MIGAIIGDIVGSRFEFDFNNCKSKKFELFGPGCDFTDDTVLTVAIWEALEECGGDWSKLYAKTERNVRDFARRYPGRGYGGRFCSWIDNPQMGPYNSFGNGAGMRVSPVAYFAKSLEEVKRLSHEVTAITHNHPEGIKGAESVAVATWLALHGKNKDEIRRHIEENYYKLDFTLDGIRDSYHMDETCQGSVPQALEAFFESTSFEDAIRNAISIGGDSDTIAAMTGAVAEAYYGVPKVIVDKAMGYLAPELVAIVGRARSCFAGRLAFWDKTSPFSV